MVWERRSDPDARTQPPREHDMADGFRSTAGRAAPEILWRDWSPGAFGEAVRQDKPILLNLRAVWCHWCRHMDESTYSDASLVELVNDRLIPIRVDADRYPHVQDRYIAGGWPTNAFLTPTGEVLWAGTYVDTQQFLSVAGSVLQAWDQRRDALQAEIELRRKAMDAARSRRPPVGIVRREAADDVLAVLQETWDTANAGFGDAPKFPQSDAVLLLLEHGRRTGAESLLGMAERTLDGMLAGELWDPVDGGFFRYALQADWTEPHHEKLLETQAGLLRAYAVGAAVFRREDFARIARETVRWVDEQLARPDELWGASQEADPHYYALDAGARRARAVPAVDPVLYLDRNAAWIQALAEAGGRLGEDGWIERARSALVRLLDTLTVDGALHHFQSDDERPALPHLLVDVVAALQACLALAQATGDADFTARAVSIAAAAEATLWAEQGGFFDHARGELDLGALRYRDRPFELNALMARALLDLTNGTGERRWRGLAERTLAVLSPLANRHGAGGSVFAGAVEDFFEAPLRVFVIGQGGRAAALRAAALRSGEPDRRVWTLPGGGTVGTLRFPPAPDAVAYVCGSSGPAGPVSDPERLVEAVSAVR
jgi:uncharacterized protein